MPRRKKEDEIALADRKGPPRGAANARERTRMRVLSKAFGRLKLTLPWVPPDTKLSKLDTLRLATSYISHLQRVLDEEEGEEKADSETNVPVSRMDLRCWPYGHQRPPHPVNPAIHPAEKDFSGSGGNNKSISSSPPPASMLDLSKVCDEKEVRWKPVQVGSRRVQDHLQPFNSLSYENYFDYNQMETFHQTSCHHPVSAVECKEFLTQDYVE